MSDAEAITKETSKKTTPRFDKDKILAIQTALETAEISPPNLTKIEALHSLKLRLVSARARGHSIDSIVVILKSQGLEVSARAVAQVLRKSGAPAETRGKSKSRKVQVDVKR